MLPNDFPPEKVCMATLGNGRKAVCSRGIHEKLGEEVREQTGRHKELRAGIINGRKKGTTSYDAGKKIKGRKRHILVDRLGLIRSLSVQPADRRDRDSAKWVLQKVAVTATRLTLIWADGGYAGK